MTDSQDTNRSESESGPGSESETEPKTDPTPKPDTEPEPHPDGGVDESKPLESASAGVNEQFENIRKTRRQRAIGWVVLTASIAFVTIQGLVATEFFSDRTRFTWSHFADRMGDYFPVTTNEIPGLDAGIPFLDIGSYWEFIMSNELIYDPEVGRLIFQFPPYLGDYYAFFFEELGMFTVFGEAGTTLAMGVVGTILGFPLALLFSVLASERVTPFPINLIFRAVMSFIRSIPAIVWALIFVALVGLGAAAATLAIALNTIGNLGRLFVEELEELEQGPIEAMRTTGASKPQVVFFGMLSQVRTSFIAWTLYILEINVRSAVTVGVIGAGGLGAVVATQESRLMFGNMMATLFVIFVLVFVVELFSQRLRARLRSDQEKQSIRELITGFPNRMADSLLR
ncbi:phosphonate ABC transporter permease [Natrialba hulunbeirensis JCM 10989]|uniref:Phosphonate ABC transporter permease n=1 Tax=Natrialba hulunbeirensis JCM 10989 TaxID=1227493 RepID=L9ZYB8_9EURY|nr:phosphonate ABC transporter, permease protein PhnE [Natrialba hulunbeirensis]ELY91319.1 phosphonate ABC transporter permease [Natrialba hulunbeirensis JCM 10989]